MNILRLRQTSACECIYRLCHLKMRESSRLCVFLNTRKPELRYRMLKFDSHGNAVGYYDNIVIRYEQRPLQHTKYDFENMSLLEFAMLFQPYYQKRFSNLDPEMNDDDEDSIMPTQRTKFRLQLITLQNKTKMKVRNNPAVVRVPYFRLNEDSENFYYSMLVQYLPFRSEAALLDGFNNAQEAFLAKEQLLLEINTNMKMYRERDQQLEAAFTKIHAFEILDTFESDEQDAEEEINIEDDLCDEEFERAKNAMNICQRKIFNYITQSIQLQLDGDPNRIRMFITGGAGTGKTFVLKTLKAQINRCYGKLTL